MSRPYWLPISIGRLLRARRSLPGTGKAKIHAKRRALTVPAHRRSHGGTQERLQQTHFYTSPNCPAYAYTYTYQVDHRPRRESSSAPRKALPLQEGYSPFLMQPGGFPRTVLTVSIPPPPPLRDRVARWPPCLPRRGSLNTCQPYEEEKARITPGSSCR